MPNLALMVVGVCLVGKALSYQFDSAIAPNTSIILPPPQTLTNGNITSLIDPCTVNITTVVQSLVLPAAELPSALIT